MKKLIWYEVLQLEDGSSKCASCGEYFDSLYFLHDGGYQNAVYEARDLAMCGTCSNYEIAGLGLEPKPTNIIMFGSRDTQDDKLYTVLVEHNGGSEYKWTDICYFWGKSEEEVRLIFRSHLCLDEWTASEGGGWDADDGWNVINSFDVVLLERIHTDNGPDALIEGYRKEVPYAGNVQS